MLLDKKLWTSNTYEESYVRIVNNTKNLFNTCDLKVKTCQKEKFFKTFIENTANV